MDKLQKSISVTVLTIFIILNSLLCLQSYAVKERYNKVPTLIIIDNEVIEINDYITQQKINKDKSIKKVSIINNKVTKKRVNKNKEVTKTGVPQHFTTDQKQQTEKVQRITNTQYGQDIFRYAKHSGQKYGVEADLVLAIILTESGFNQYAKNGNSYGLMQLSENTTASKMCTNLYNTQCNIEASTKHFAGLRAKYKGDNKLALAAYNAGGGAVDKSLRRTGDIPPSTKQYINKIYKYKEVIREFS